MDAQGNHIGYLAEQEKGMANAMARQWFRTHRSFVTHVFDKHENEVLRVSHAPSQNSLQVLITKVRSLIAHSHGSILGSKSTIH